MASGLENIETIESPFRRFVTTIGVFPTAFTDAMTYYECLAYLVKYLEDTVIPAVNENAEALEELQTLFVQLKSYVDNYFDNLDVQEEINKKLDEMVESGQLQQIVEAYFIGIQEQINEQDQKIAAQTTSLNNALSQQTNAINELDSRMDAFSQLAEGSTTGDAELIDGRTSFDGRTSANIGDNVRLYQGCAFKPIITTLTKVSTKRRNYNLTETDDPSYDYYILPTEKGKLYMVDVNAGGTRRNVVFAYEKALPAEQTTTSNLPYVFIGTGASVYVNNKKDYLTPFIGEANLVGGQNELSYYYNDITASATLDEGKYIRANGTTVSSSNFNTYTITPKKGHYYIIYTAYNSGAPLGYQNGIVYPDNSGSYGIQPQTLYKIFSQSTDAITFNCMLSHMIGDFKIYESKFAYIGTETEREKLQPITGLFSKAFFIGDSLTNGQTYKNGSPSSYTNYYNYPYFLNKFAKFDSYTKLGINGASASDWWNGYNNRITDSDCLYFVWLGTNDGLTDTVATDCSGDDYTQFADTETGNLGKILGKISSLTNTKIVMLNCYVTGGDLTNTNKAIQDLATKYNAIVVNVNQDICRESGYHTAFDGKYNSVHMNNQGYNLIANLVYNQLNAYLANNAGSLESYKVAN